MAAAVILAAVPRQVVVAGVVAAPLVQAAVPREIIVAGVVIDPVVAAGTDRELSANFDQESSATRVERDVSGDVGAYFNVARHAVKCAEQRRTQGGA